MSAVGEAEDGPPIFRAVSSSARQLFQLLNCIRFAPKAQVQISNEGIRFAVEESRVMQGWLSYDYEYGSCINSFRNRLS
jgi:cell cycle checkpoint protein